MDKQKCLAPKSFLQDGRFLIAWQWMRCGNWRKEKQEASKRLEVEKCDEVEEDMGTSEGIESCTGGVETAMNGEDGLVEEGKREWMKLANAMFEFDKFSDVCAVVICRGVNAPEISCCYSCE
jgi:hypothetical protein